MRRSIATVGAVVLGLALTPGAVHAAPSTLNPVPSPADQAALSAGIPVADKAAPGTKPAGPNPYLALVPDAAKADYSGWAAYMAKQATAKAAARLKAARALAPASPLLADEDEPDGTRGANDSPASAQLIKGFGTGTNQNPKLRILGSLDPEAVTAVSVPANAEDDGAIPLAGDTGIGTSRDGITTSAVIGDGPHGSAGTGTNDFDFYKLRATAGEVIRMQTATPTGALDTLVALYTPDGTIVAQNDDSDGSFDSKLTYAVPATGDYYAVVAAYSGLPADPFDPASGDGGASEGPYTVTITAGEDDRDFFAVKLRAGDVLGASVEGSPANARSTASAFPSPATRKTMWRPSHSAESVSVMRGTRGSRPACSSPTTARSRMCSVSWPGKSDATCASGPSPSSTTSRRGICSPSRSRSPFS
jgi:hypothetical protein